MIEQMDFAILDFIQEFLRNGFLDKVFSFITHLGDGGMIWIIAGIAMLFFKRYRKCGIMLLLSLAVCAALTSIIIKPLVGRLRPFQVMGIEPYINPPMGSSFPSGHTSSSFTAAVSVLLCYKREGAGAIALATLIAFSRMYFYVHFPTDVLAGALLGAIVANSVHKVATKYLQRL